MKCSKLVLSSIFLLAPSTLVLANDETVGELLRRVKMAHENNQMSSKVSSTIPQDAYFSTPRKKHFDIEAIKPPPSSELISNTGDKNRIELEKITDQQISELFKLTQKLKNSPNRGELWLRLAELYVEKADYITSRKQLVYEEKLKQYTNHKISTKPHIDLKDAKAYNSKAIQLYEYYARDFKNDNKMDQALYFLGYNYFELGDVQKGTAYYSRLASEFPKSQYVNEAYFSIAEYYFDTNQWSRAYENYSRVIKSKTGRLFAFAVYKGAWCLYKNGKAQEGLKYLETIVRLSRDKDQENDLHKRKINLAKLDEEAKRDIVIFYIDAGNPENAYEYFKDLFGDKAVSELEKLAYFYSDKGFKEKSHVVFKKLIALNPMSPKAFDYQYQIVSSYANLLNNQVFKQEMYDLIRGYGSQSKWFKVNEGNAQVIENSQKVSESFLRAYILHHHQSAQNSKGRISQEMTVEGYKLYLNEFVKSPNYPDMMFYYGELLYDLKRYSEAAEQYAWVAKNAPKGKYGAKASMNMILGLEKDLPSEEEMQKRVNKSTEKMELDSRVKKFVESGEWYLTTFPKGDKNLELRFRMARLYYLSNHFEQAEKHFKIIAKEYPRSKQAEYSTNLLLDIYNLKKDYAGLEKAASDILQNSDGIDSASVNEVKSVLEKAAFKAAQDLEEKKDFYGSAQKFESFAKKYPNSSLTAAALFNAGINYDRAAQPLKSVAAFEVVLKSNAKEALPLKIKSIQLLPKMYQDLGLYLKAANSYVVAGDQLGKEPSSYNFYYNAALLYDALNSVDKAVKNYQIYLKHARENEKAEIYFKIADLYKRNKMVSQAIENYKFYSAYGKDPEKIIESNYNNAILYAQIHEEQKSNYWKFQTIKRQKELVPQLKGPGAQYAAKFKIERTEALFNELKLIHLPEDANKLKKTVERKVGLLTQINGELAEIVKYDSPDEIVRALSLEGRANIHMVEAFTNAPIPKELGKDENLIKQYKDNVAQGAKPFKDKAIESFKAAIKQGRDFNSYTEFYFLSIKYIRDLEPGYTFNKDEKALPYLGLDWMGLK